MSNKAGCLYVTGIGPGGYDNMTLRAVKVLETCDVIIGYPVYTELVKPYFPDKEYITTPMRKEKERCEIAFKEALKGRKAALVCSGDPGVFGLSGIVLELAPDYPDVDIEIIPGVTAACSGGAVAGAPLMGDFAVISLSDILVPWELIEKRLYLAADADMPVCLYNPGSKSRKDHLKKAAGILMEHRSGDAVCALVSNIDREGSGCVYCTLRELLDRDVDMFTTVFIGNSKTYMTNGRMVTPRKYSDNPLERKI